MITADPPRTLYFFVDEAGAPTLFDAKAKATAKVLVGQHLRDRAGQRCSDSRPVLTGVSRWPSTYIACSVASARIDTPMSRQFAGWHVNNST